MFAVHFLENRNQLLTQLLKTVPAEGENVVIKGRKGKVTSVLSLTKKMSMYRWSLKS